MKKIVLVVAVVLAAVGAFAFTTSQKKVEVPKVEENQTTYIWFYVPPGQLGNPLCDNFASVSPALVTGHNAPTNDPLADMEEFELTEAQAAGTFDCPTPPTYVCAIGYAVTASNFVKSGGQWKPTGSAVPLVRICRQQQ